MPTAHAKPTKEPARLRCGCAVSPRYPKQKNGQECVAPECYPGERCLEGGWLGAALEDRRAEWLGSGARPGDPDFVRFYGPLLAARVAYHRHFGQCYERERDGLWQDHLAAFSDRQAATRPR